MNQSKLLKVFLLLITSLTLWSGCNFRSSEKTSLEFPLPLNLKAVYWGSDVQYPILGLVILDDLNFVIVGKKDEFLVNGKTVEVEKITRFGIGDYKLLIEVLDTQGGTFYIECSKNNNVTNNELILIVFDSIKMVNQDTIKWIEADEILEQLK